MSQAQAISIKKGRGLLINNIKSAIVKSSVAVGLSGTKIFKIPGVSANCCLYQQKPYMEPMRFIQSNIIKKPDPKTILRSYTPPFFLIDTIYYNSNATPRQTNLPKKNLMLKLYFFVVFLLRLCYNVSHIRINVYRL